MIRKQWSQILVCWLSFHTSYLKSCGEPSRPLPLSLSLFSELPNLDESSLHCEDYLSHTCCEYYTFLRQLYISQSIERKCMIFFFFLTKGVMWRIRVKSPSRILPAHIFSKVGRFSMYRWPGGGVFFTWKTKSLRTAEYNRNNRRVLLRECLWKQPLWD